MKITSIFQLYFVFFICPAILGALIRLLLRKFSFGYLCTVIFAILCAVKVYIAHNPPVGGDEGYGFQGFMATCLMLGSLITGIVIRIKNKAKA